MTNRLTGKRWITGLNAGVALALAAGLAVALNILAARYPGRADLGRVQNYALSAKTLELLSRLPTEVQVTVFLSSEHELFREIRSLLKEYAYASDRVRVEYIDPHRDLAQSKALVLRYEVTDPEVVVLAAAGRQAIVPVKDFGEYDYIPMLSGRPRVMTAFRGEQVLSSALQGLLQAKKPVVYFMVGHGERRVGDYDQVFGYSILGRNLQREQIEIKTLNLAETPAIPPDCDLLAIAGPTRSYTRAEADLIKTFLANSGRLLLLLDAGPDAGLGGLLKDWGVGLAEDRVVGVTLTGRELLVTRYGKHPITDHLAAANIATIFNGPRSVQPLAAGTNALPVQAADKPRLTVLAWSSPEAWAEMSLNQTPPRLDAGVDRPGPVPVAVAVEKGLPRAMDVEIKPSRMVAVGDSSLVANGALLAGYNPDLIMNSVNWLLERPDSLPIAAKNPGRIRVVLSRSQLKLAYGILVFGMPAAVLAVGLLVWLRRRR